MDMSIGDSQIKPFISVNKNDNYAPQSWEAAIYCLVFLLFSLHCIQDAQVFL